MATQYSLRENAQGRNYLREIQEFYQKKPVVQVSLQLMLSIFSVAFFGFFAIRPTLGSIGTLIKKIEDLEKASVLLDQKIVQLNNAQEVLSREGVGIITSSRRIIPTDKDLGRFSKIVELLEAESGVLITDIKLEPPEGENTENKYLLQVVGSGNYQQIRSFVDSLSSSERAVEIESITLDKASDVEGSTISFSVNAKFFYLNQNK